MKMIKFAAFLVALVVGLVGSAMATSWKADQSGNYRVSRGVLTSATAPTGQNSTSSSMTDTVYLSSTTPVTATIIRTLQDGTVLSSQNVSLTGATPVSITLPAPQSHQLINISPSLPLTGSNALHAVIVESK